MTNPTPGTQQQSTPPPTGHPHAKQSNTAAVTTVAGSRINGATAHTVESPKSPTTEPAQYSFTRSIESANKRTDAGEFEEARARFKDINSQLKAKKQPKDSLIPVLYFLGLAYTYRVGSPESTENAGKAFQALNVVCQNNKSWETFDQGKKSRAYCSLKNCYERLKPLIPAGQTDSLKELDQKIAECNPHILPLHAFNALVYEAERCVRQKNLVRAGTLYSEAAELIKENNERDFLIPKVQCILKHANICEVPDLKSGLSKIAKETLFQIYDTKEHFFNADQSNKKDIFKLLHSCFIELAKLFPETETLTRLEIQYRIEECQKEFTPDPQTPMPNKVHKTRRPDSSTTHLTSGPSESTGPEQPPRKYTRGPSGNGSWGIGRIFAVLVLAALAITGVVFYRRHIVKID